MTPNLSFSRIPLSAAAGWLILMGWIAPTSAAILDWSASSGGTPVYSYTPGATSATYVNVDGSGVDIVFNFSGGTLVGASPRRDNMVLTGGEPPASAFNLFLNINPGNSTDDLTIELAFYQTGTSQTQAAQMNNVSFTLFDVDRSGGGAWQDQLRNFEAENSETGTTGLTATATVVNSSNTSIANNGTSNMVITGISNVPNNSNQANATITYAQNLTSLEFGYGHTNNNGSPSGIGLYNIEFSVVPEAEVYGAGIGLLLLCGLHFWRKEDRPSRSPDRA